MFYFSLVAMLLCIAVQGVSAVTTTHGYHDPAGPPIKLTTKESSFGSIPMGVLSAAMHVNCSQCCCTAVQGGPQWQTHMDTTAIKHLPSV